MHIDKIDEGQMVGRELALQQTASQFDHLVGKLLEM
jgi:hypothetical protein